jgi:protocatechuate 4,5-dioxygenase beta chain
MKKLSTSPKRWRQFSMHDLVKEAGAQGTELILWLTMRGALSAKVKKIHSNYDVAISNTATGLVVLENVA